MRLSTSKYSELKNAYSAVYNQEQREQFNEEKNIQQFLDEVDSLVAEGYDLSEFTYDELYNLYEENISENPVVAGGANLLRLMSRIPGVKTTAGAAALDQIFTGGKGRRWLGRAYDELRRAGHSIPEPGSSNDPFQPPQTAKPPKSSQERNPYGLNQSFDVFDAIKGHLLDEGYADTEEAALAIMANMSEEWKESILQEGGILDAAKRGLQRLSGEVGNVERNLQSLPKPGGVAVPKPKGKPDRVIKKP